MPGAYQLLSINRMIISGMDPVLHLKIGWYLALACLSRCIEIIMQHTAHCLKCNQNLTNDSCGLYSIPVSDSYFEEQSTN